MTERERWMMAWRRDMKREIVAYLEAKRDSVQLRVLAAPDKSHEEASFTEEAQRLDALAREIDGLP